MEAKLKSKPGGFGSTRGVKMNSSWKSELSNARWLEVLSVGVIERKRGKEQESQLNFCERNVSELTGVAPIRRDSARFSPIITFRRRKQLAHCRYERTVMDLYQHNQNQQCHLTMPIEI